MDREFEASVRGALMAEASRKVREESMRVNAEFAAVERDTAAEQETDLLRVVTFKNRMHTTRIRRPAK